MTDLEQAKRHALLVRHGERVRWDERTRAFDILETKAYGTDDAVAAALYEAATEIIRSKP